MESDMRLGRYLGGLVSLGLLCSLLMARPGNAQTVADFYAGRTINVYIGFTPGGAYDIYARHLARFPGQHCQARRIFWNRKERQ